MLENAQDYLSCKKVNVASCLILDVEMPGMTGLELQLTVSGINAPPSIFFIGHEDGPIEFDASRWKSSRNAMHCCLLVSAKCSHLLCQDY